VGQILVAVALAVLTSTVIDGRHAGWTSPRIVLGFVVASAAVIALVIYESRRAEPLIDLRFFRSAPFAGATVIAVLSFASFSGFLFLNSLYLQEARGLGASAAGLCTLPVAAAVVVCSPLSGRLVGRGMTRFALVVAGVALSAGALLLTDLRVQTSLAHLILAYGVFGVGMGMVNAPITNTAVSGMPRAQAGVASAIASTSRQVGASLGVALAGPLAGAGIASAHTEGFAEATHAMFWLVSGFGGTVLFIGLASTSAWARSTTDRVALLLDPPEQPNANAAARANSAMGASAA
jgi:predicted MFS family arabinose efflux permease